MYEAPRFPQGPKEYRRPAGPLRRGLAKSLAGRGQAGAMFAFETSDGVGRHAAADRALCETAEINLKMAYHSV